MRYLFIISLFLFSFTSSSSSDGIVGVWLSQIKDGKIEIYKSNGKYHGKVVWIKEPKDANGKPIKDIHNPKDKLKSRAIYNLVIIKDLVYEDEKWSGGTVYDPKEGKTYDCSIWLEDGKLKLRGYLGWFYDTKTWTRVK
jgi:uncharacterized protein (DUF2147 family)